MKRSVSAVLIVLGVASLAGSSAQAFDDQVGTFGPIMSFIGVGGNDVEKGDIDFRERAPLVIPKAGGLPAPRPGAAGRVANWPQDQDVVRRREDAARARVPTQININANPALDKQELMRGRSDDAPVAVQLCDTYVNGTQDCAPTTMEKIKRVFTGRGPDDKNVVVVGKEPDRAYLTEPPKGYRRVTQTTRVSVEGGYERPDNADAAKYIRDQGKR